MRRDQVDKKTQRKGLAPLLPIRRNMTSLIYKRTKYHVLHVKKSCFAYCERLMENTL